MVIKKYFKKLITTTLIGITVFIPINSLSYAKSKNLIFNNINIEQGISQSTIEIIFQDSKGYIWLGTSDGLNRYNGYEFKIYNYEEYQNSISNNGITDITEDEDRNICINTVSGVNKINTVTNEISNYTELNGKINEDSTTEIIVTKDNKILVGTYQGLNIYNHKTKEFERYTTSDGIANSTIYGVLVDDNDNIWVSTNKGISQIDTKNNTVNNLSVTDGLQGNEFNGNAAFKSKSGELFFGGINGLNAFYPEDVTSVDNKSKVIFDGFKVDDKDYLDINGLKLDNSVDNIKVKFFTPIYSSNKNISYEYELIGASSHKETTKENYVTYNDLLPGKYIFKVRALDSRGYISDSETIEFSIKYPFWMSPIACFIYLAIAVLHIRNNRHKLKNLDRLVKLRTKELEEQIIKNEELYNGNIKNEENKHKYLVNLSHELRTPLNVIISTNRLLLKLSKNDIIKKDKLAYYIDISERNCNRLLNLVNNILDHTKLQSGMYTLNLKNVDIIYLVEETSLTLIDYIKSKSIELIIDREVEEKVILCDDYEIERCIVNLVSNAAKFIPKGGTITIKDLDDKVMISVLDTGVGIEEKYHKTIFDRFNQVDSEESKGGSGLGLSITSKIVELHKGEIYVESKVGEGSNFVIILPVDPNKK